MPFGKSSILFVTTMDFDIEKYMYKFFVLMMAQRDDWPSTDTVGASRLSELQRQSLACVAGYQVYEQLKEHRGASVTIEIAANGDISIS